MPRRTTKANRLIVIGKVERATQPLQELPVRPHLRQQGVSFRLTSRADRSQLGQSPHCTLEPVHFVGCTDRLSQHLKLTGRQDIFADHRSPPALFPAPVTQLAPWAADPWVDSNA